MTPDSSRYFLSGRPVSDTPFTITEFGERSMLGSGQIDLQMLLERCSTDSPAGQVELSNGITVFMPENYEPNYPYPLIAWVSGREDTQEDLLALMPRISSHNFFGVTVNESPTLVEDLYDVVYEIRREYHIHSERIHLAAIGNQAASGLDALLQRPNWFGGLISLGGVFSRPHLPLMKFHELHGKRVLLGMCSVTCNSTIPETIHIARLLHAGRMEVATRVYRTVDEITPRMLSDINHWLMDGIRESNLV